MGKRNVTIQEKVREFGKTGVMADNEQRLDPRRSPLQNFAELEDAGAIQKFVGFKRHWPEELSR